MLCNAETKVTEEDSFNRVFSGSGSIFPFCTSILYYCIGKFTFRDGAVCETHTNKPPSHNLVPRAHITLVEIDTRSVGIKIIQRMIVIFVYSWIIVVTFVRNSAEKRLCVCWKSLVNGLHLGSLKLWTDFKTAKPLLKAPKTPNRRLQILYLAWLSRTNFWWTIPSKFNQNFPKTRKTFYIFYRFFMTIAYEF